MTTCIICGEKIAPKDREAIHYEIFSLHGEGANSGDICGDCVYAQDTKFFKLWSVRKDASNHGC